MGKYRWQGILQSIHKAAEIQPKTFSTILDSPSVLHLLQHKKAKINSVSQLLSIFIKINLPKFLLCLLFFTLTLALTVASPWIVNFLVKSLLAQEHSNLVAMLLLMLGYKIGGAAINILCDFMYSSLGFQYFAFIYWQVLNNYNSDRIQIGKIVNIVEYDCNLLSNIVYSVLTSVFYFSQIMVLFMVLGNYLISTEPYSAFVVLVCGYIACQVLASLLTFYINRRYITQKDRRLGTNIGDYDQSRMLHERGRQLKANRLFLLTKVLCKMISLIFPILINVYVFLVADRDSIRQNQFTILILINLIRNPVSSLMLALNLNAEIVNSCRRIVHLLKQNGSSKTDSQKGSDDTSQGLVAAQKRVIGNSVLSQEEGNIQLVKIRKWLTSSIPKRYWAFFLLSFLLLLFTRYNNNKIIRSMIASSEITPSLMLGLAAQLLSPAIFYIALIFGIQKVTQSLFTKLPHQIDYEILNRLSGDIATVDRTVTTNAFEISSNLTVILGSYLYSIISIEVLWVIAVLAVFLAAAVWAAYSLNRFIMRSRREVYRHQLEMKSDILAGVMVDQKISESGKLQQAWSQIFECKIMGLLIQNYYIFLVSILMLCLSLLFIALSEYLVTESTTKSVLLMICLNLDSDMLMLFYAWVRLELSLVSFLRVVNILKL